MSDFSKIVPNQIDKAGADATKCRHHDGGDMTLVLHSKDGGDEAFLTFSADETYAMACAEEGTPKFQTVFSPPCVDLISSCR